MPDEPIKKKDLTDFMTEIDNKIEKITQVAPIVETPSQGTGESPAPAPEDPEIKQLRKERDVLKKQIADQVIEQRTKILESFDKERKEKYKDASLEVLEAVKDEQSGTKTPFIGDDSRSQDDQKKKSQPIYLDRRTQKTIYT